MKKHRGTLLSLVGIKPDEIGYNPAVVSSESNVVVAVRVENVRSYWLDPQCYDPHIQFFKRIGDELVLILDAPVFHLYEDPFATWIRVGEQAPQLLFGAVKVEFSDKIPVVCTYFFVAPSFKDLDETNPVAIIRGVKDVRVCQLPDRKLAVFTRPQEGDAYPGRIGFTIINTLEELETAVLNTRLLKFEVSPTTKMGPNEAFLRNGLLHVYCHLATTDAMDKLHYQAFEFSLDPEKPFTNTTPIHKVADRADFPKNVGLSKGSVFDDVVFPGGTGGPELKEFYVGVEDACIGVIDLAT